MTIALTSVNTFLKFFSEIPFFHALIASVLSSARGKPVVATRPKGYGCWTSSTGRLLAKPAANNLSTACANPASGTCRATATTRRRRRDSKSRRFLQRTKLRGTNKSPVQDVRNHCFARFPVATWISSARANPGDGFPGSAAHTQSSPMSS